jgi:peptidylprolyl isomerase
MRRATLTLLAVAAFALAACGDDDKKDETAADTGTTAATTETAPSAPAPTEGGDPKDLGSKPKVEIPKGKAPTKLVARDIVEGKGEAAKAGDTVTVQYVGVLYEGGAQFDASWDRGQPFQFQLGAGRVIPGWDEGVEGMKVGGRRKLIIPSDKAYGPQGQPPDIPPDATLVFVIDLQRVG